MALVDVIPAPDNPHKGEALTDAQARGALVFKKALAEELRTENPLPFEVVLPTFEGPLASPEM